MDPKNVQALFSVAVLSLLLEIRRRASCFCCASFLFVTSSSRKVRHLSHNLQIRGLLHDKVRFKVVNLDIVEPQIFDVRQIALHKAKEAFALLQSPVLVEDSGFFLDELRGFPGSLAHYALDTIGAAGLAKLMAGAENRQCHYITCAVYTDSEGKPHVFESVNRGLFAEDPADMHQSRQEASLAPQKLSQPPHDSATQPKVQLHHHFISADSPVAVPEAALTAAEYQQYREARSALSCYGKFSEWMASSVALAQ
jgi:non-canonical purine NTP pyrophosphatase (RdgB/HAM1 family)